MAAEDAQLAQRLRQAQWLCDSLAHAVPAGRADTDELAELLDALPALEQGLRGYVGRRITIEGSQER